MNRWVLFFSILTGAAAAFAVLCGSCRSQKKAGRETATAFYVKVSPDFDADSAYAYLEKQTAFGPRVPGTEAHAACGDYLSAKLKDFGAGVVEQQADVTHYNGQNIRIRNIIGSYRTEKEKRILLFAHWDSRPFADRETDPQEQQRPIPGADDGASGVAVLLEIARRLQTQPAECGIDIVFFDLEDWGQAEFDKNYLSGNWWCVGSRYWSENPHIPSYKARFGILLDMVGAADATFPYEGYSLQHAPKILSRIWSIASGLGYGNFFIRRNGGYITDDHLPVIENLNIPCVNIINLKNSDTGFALHWHTHSDDMRNIRKETLKAAGQTVMEVIYREK